MRYVKEAIQKCFKELHPNSILDLGCKSGKFSLKFAQKGISVTGVDKKDLEICQDNFKFIHKDIRDFEFKEKYDLIFASMVLHFLKNEEALKIIEKMQENTSVNGFNFLICMSDEDDCAKRNQDDFYPDSKELEKLYFGWEIVKNELCLSKEHQDENTDLHKHKIIVFLARKKNQNVNSKR